MGFQWPQFGSAATAFCYALFGAAVAFVLVILPSTSLKTAVLAAAVGCILCVLGAFFSGNVRLYCLWGLMLTLPLDLGKHFGPMIQKMGGENQFRDRNNGSRSDSAGGGPTVPYHPAAVNHTQNAALS